MSFCEYVAIKCREVPAITTDYKAMSSFARAVNGYDGLPTGEMLKIWGADMIDKGLSPSSRQRYIKKISTIYDGYSSGKGHGADVTEALRQLRDYDDPIMLRDIKAATAAFSRMVDPLLTEAVSNPWLGMMFYLLFHASDDIEHAISLAVPEGGTPFPQLDGVIGHGGFHHRRKYLFPLGQSRKRMPQLVREATGNIGAALRERGIITSRQFSPSTIVALWITKAIESGVRYTDIKAVVGTIPGEYRFLDYVTASQLDPASINAIRRRVAEAFSPSVRRWYAIKLKRGVRFDTVDALLGASRGDFPSEAVTMFYPRREITRRVDKKLVTELIPVIPDIAFFNARPRHVRHIDRLLRAQNSGWVFRNGPAIGSDYSVIDNSSMLNFQLMVGVFTPDMKIGLTRETPIDIGRTVKITGGIMAGYTGRIHDIKDTDGGRLIYIRISADYSIRAEIQVPEYYVSPITP